MMTLYASWKIRNFHIAYTNSKVEDPRSAMRIPIISGSGRSGTTWVLDVLAKANDMRTAFEPLHPVVLKKISDYSNRFIRDGETHDDLKRYLTNIFSGDFRNTWIDYRVRPDRLVPSLENISGKDKTRAFLAKWKKLFRQSLMYRRNFGKPVITKFIRANLMYLWLLENFNARIVHIMRHPGAVIESKLRLGGDDWNPTSEMSRYLQQKPVKTWLSGYMDCDEIDDLSSAGQFALIWCIENCIPMSVTDDRVLTVHFETLAAHDQSVWEQLVNHLDLAKIPTTSQLIKPSQQSRPEDKLTTYDFKMTYRWRSSLSGKDLKEIDRVLDCFGVGKYSVDLTQPLAEN